MKQSEAARLPREEIRYIAFLVANDGISIVASKENTWASRLTVAELKKIWDTGPR